MCFSGKMKALCDMDVKFSNKDVKVSIPQKLLGYVSVPQPLHLGKTHQINCRSRILMFLGSEAFNDLFSLH